MIPNDLIQKIIESTDIVSVISEEVKLTKRGVNYIGCCPFHSEKTPSFTVSPAKGIFKCFGCGKGGNVATFVSEIENITWFEAMKELASRAKIELPKPKLSSEEKAAIDSREKLYIVNNFAAKTWKSNFEASPGKQYMIERGFDQTDFEAFGIGYAPESWDFLFTEANKAGHRSETLIEAGLLARNNDKKRTYDRFRDRVIFPIHTPTGRLAGFTGRILQTTDKAPKYLNSPDSIIFKKGQLLFGLYQAKKEIIKEGRCLLVEGNTDVIRFHKCGLINTVATSGTALTTEHARIIHRFTDNVTILFDGDNAGIKASLRGVEVLLSEGLNVYIAMLPKGEDPDSFAKGKSRDELYKWIEENEKDFVVLNAEKAAEEMKNRPAEKARIVNELRDIIQKVPDEITRATYINDVSKSFGVSAKTISKGIKNEDSDLFGIEANAEAIKEADEIYIHDSKEDCMESINNKKENSIAVPSFPLRPEHIGAIEVLTKNLVFNFELPSTFLIEKEPACIIDIKKLSERGFRITVRPPENMKFDSEYVSFIEVYFNLLHRNADIYNTESRSKAVEKAAEYLSKQEKTVVSIKTGELAKMFGITKAAFDQVLKPYINKQKSKASISYEAIKIDDERFIFDDIDRLPEYVDRNFINKYRHFPVQNKKGEKIFYMFQGENGQLFRVANFYMEPLFQVKDDDDEKKNRRIVKLNHSELNSSRYVEIPSNEMIEFGAFKKFLWRQGPYLLRNAKPQQLDMILDSIALDFPVTNELKVFGQQEEGFYAFCNAIFVEGRIERMNELGLVTYGKNTYYSPSVSVIYKDMRKDNDKYAQDRYFIYRETNRINLTQWASLIMQVYKYNNNGYWVVIMTIMAAFRSNIFDIDRLFTTLFLIGPTGCGKSEMAQSMRAVYMHPDAPMFNLNSGTDAAFFTMLERFCDALIIFEEYNDMQISDAKFQGLKAAVYDGEGKTKRKDAGSKDLDISEVRAVPLVLGQESPERDDASLANRTVIIQVKKVEYWTDEETQVFQDLKKHERLGLTNVLIEILQQRDTVKKHFQKKLRLVQKEMRDDLRSHNISFQPRILSTVSLFASMLKLIEEEVKSFQLPFTYADFYPIARQKLIEQSESIQQTNRLSVFFDTMLLLSEDEGPRSISRGKEYKIEKHDSIEVRKGKGNTELIDFNGDQVQLLFMRIDMIHPKYKAVVGVNEHLKTNNLITYIKDHPAYIGQVKMTTFSWKNEVRMDNGHGNVVSVMKEESKRTSATVMNYEILRNDWDFGDEFIQDLAEEMNEAGLEEDSALDEAIEGSKVGSKTKTLPF